MTIRDLILHHILIFVKMLLYLEKSSMSIIVCQGWSVRMNEASQNRERKKISRARLNK